MGHHYEQSKRELRVILVTWALFCFWVVGYCSLRAYPLVYPDDLKLVLGMPSWVFWGIALPWCCATAVTILFGLRGMKDQPLENQSTPRP